MWLLLNSHQPYPVCSWLPEPMESHCHLSMLAHRLNPLLTLFTRAHNTPQHLSLPPSFCAPLQLQNTSSLPRLFMFLPYWELSGQKRTCKGSQPPLLLHLVPRKCIPSTSICLQGEKIRNIHLHFKEKGHMNGCRAQAGRKRNLHTM